MTKEVVIFNGEFCKVGLISVFAIGRDLVREAAARDDIHLAAFVPRGDSYYKFASDADPYGVGGNIDYLPTLNDSVTELPYGYINQSFKKALNNRNDYYLCVNQRITAGPMLQKILSKPFIGFQCEMVNYVSLSDLDVPAMHLYPSIPMETLAGLVLSWNILWSRAWLDRLAIQMSEVFRPSLVRQFKRRSYPSFLGIDCQRVDEVQSIAREDKEQFVFVWGGRMTGFKNLPKSLEVADVLFRSGKNIRFDFYLCNPGTIPKDKLEKMKKDYPFLRIFINKSQEEFWAACKAADVFVCFSEHESYGLAYMECLRAGVPVIFWDKYWVHVWINDEYPYIVRNVSEAVAVCNTLYADRDAGRPHVETASAHIEANHNRKKHCRDVVDAWVALSRRVRTGKRPKGWDDVL